MDVAELAAKLDGCEYRDEVDRVTERSARMHKLVIVFGASDDLIEFRGAINDEIGAYEGATVWVDSDGLQPLFEDCEGDKDALREYFKREGCGKSIEAVWDDGEYAWSYKTEIPHATFEIKDDGELYCLGIVFSLERLSP